MTIGKSRKDTYYRRAKRENYRSRAVYKLLEIQERFRIIQKTDTVLEIGSSPGGWSQIIREITTGSILSIDRERQSEIESVTFLKRDIFNEKIEKDIERFLSESGSECFNVVLSDAMDRTSGIQSKDHAVSIAIGERVMELSYRFLCIGGRVLLKQFQGSETQDFKKRHSGRFENSRITTTSARRKGSREIYILFSGYLTG